VPDREADVAEIESIVRGQHDVLDAAAFAGPWRERSWAVTAAGTELEGSTAIVAARHESGPFEDWTPGTVELLGDDVAIVHAYARAPDRSMIALYVLARELGRWQIVARHDTLVAA
jgi:hypothetical protein